MAEWHPLPARLDGADGAPSAAWQKLNRDAERRAASRPPAPLPSLDHLRRSDFARVYEPSDDTFLLLDALDYEFESGAFDALPLRPASVLEVGCGSGAPSVFVRQRWDQRRLRTPLLSWATDVNPHALEAARRTAAANPSAAAAGPDDRVDPSRSPTGGGRPPLLELVRCDLASGLLPRLAGRVDVLLFNPPYVPTPDGEVVAPAARDADDEDWISASWAGGENGRRVVDRFAPQLAALLRHPTGAAYLVTVDDNRPHELARSWRSEYRLDVRPLLRRRARNEYLTIQKITWAVAPNGGGGDGGSAAAPERTMSLPADGDV